MAHEELRLQRLKLRNFKGIAELELEPRGTDVEVYGENATGKTTIADAFCWLLFGKDSLGRSDFAIKTLDGNGDALHGLEHEVEAEIQLSSGRAIDLRKVYHETWTKRRGSAKQEFSGHTTDHYIDGVPVKKGEYEAAVAEIADEDAFRLLTDPAHFPERMHWQERRALLLAMCGDAEDADVIASDSDLADLASILGERSLEDHRKVILARRRKINEELERIPVRIDEVTRTIPEVEESGAEGLRAKLNQLRTHRAAAEEERTRIGSGGEVAEKTKLLREAEAAMQEASNRVAAAASESTSAIQKELTAAQGELDEAKRSIDSKKANVLDAKESMEQLEGRMADRRARWHEIDAETLDHDEPDTCAACGQSLPAEKVEAARAKALERFNADKARRLKEVEAEGKKAKAQRDEIVAGGKDRDAALSAAEVRVEELEASVASLQAKLEKARDAAPDAAGDVEYQKAHARAQALEVEIEALREGGAEAQAQAANQVSEYDAEIAAVEGHLARIEQKQKAGARIAELESDERTLAEEFERLERELFLAEKFVRAKVRLIEDRINSRFEIARFQLFRELVNGGLEECCEVTVGGVPYGSGLNHGARIQAGLDIIRTLQEHFYMAPTVFVDQCESVTKLPDMDCQVVRLQVSADDKTLRIELGAPKEEMAPVAAAR